MPIFNPKSHQDKDADNDADLAEGARTGSQYDPTVDYADDPLNLAMATDFETRAYELVGLTGGDRTKFLTEIGKYADEKNVPIELVYKQLAELFPNVRHTSENFDSVLKKYGYETEGGTIQAPEVTPETALAARRLATRAQTRKDTRAANRKAETVGKNNPKTPGYVDLNKNGIDDKYEKAAGGRVGMYNQGGLASFLNRPKGYYLGGTTDGMADKVPATIDGAEPARLSDGEFVIPADVVGHLGNGNSDAGAKNLYGMMDRIRKDRTGTTRQGKQINPNKYLMG